MKSFLSIALLLSSLLSAAQPANKTTSMKKRLVASVNYSQGDKRDSIHHFYSNGRGSDLTDFISYTDNYNHLVEIPANGNEQKIHCDSTVNYTYSTFPQPLRFFAKTYTYTNNLVASCKTRNIRNANTSFEITRNSFGKPVKIEYSDSSAFDSSHTIRYLTYNSNQLLIKDSIFDVKNNIPETVKTFLYNQYNLDTLTSVYQYQNGSISRTTHQRKIYDASKRLISSLWQYDLNGTLQNATLDSFAYRGSDTVHNYFVEYNWQPNINDWEGSQKKHKLFGTNGSSDTLVNQLWFTPNWDTSDIKVIHYDNDGYIEHTEDYLYLGSGIFSATPISETYHFFESYFPTAVSQINSYIDVRVSPNPSKGIINVDAGNTYFNNIVITDMQGRTVYSKSASATNTTILSAQLPAGNYVLSLYNQDVRIATQKLVIE